MIRTSFTLLMAHFFRNHFPAVLTLEQARTLQESFFAVFSSHVACTFRDLVFLVYTIHLAQTMQNPDSVLVWILYDLALLFTDCTWHKSRGNLILLFYIAYGSHLAFYNFNSVAQNLHNPAIVVRTLHAACIMESPVSAVLTLLVTTILQYLFSAVYNMP